MPTAKALFSLHYTDASPEQIDAHELIQVLSSFNRIAVKASRTFYGSDTFISFRIAHVQPGSIDIQGFVEILAGLARAYIRYASIPVAWCPRHS
jgi:hypothetical protein